MPESIYTLFQDLTIESYLIAGAFFLLGLLFTWILCAGSKRRATSLLATSLEAEKNRADEAKQRLASTQKDLQILRDSESELKQNEARLITQLATEQKAAEKQESTLNNLHSKIEDSFNNTHEQFLNIAQNTLQAKQQASTKELDQRNLAIDQMLKPVVNSLQKVELRMRELEQSREASLAPLQQQSLKMEATQQKIQQTLSKLITDISHTPQPGQHLSIPAEAAKPLDTIISDEDTSDFTDTLADDFEGFTAETPGEGI